MRAFLQDPSAIVENKDDFPAKFILEYGPGVTSFVGLRFKSHIHIIHIWDFTTILQQKTIPIVFEFESSTSSPVLTLNVELE